VSWECRWAYGTLLVDLAITQKNRIRASTESTREIGPPGAAYGGSIWVNLLGGPKTRRKGLSYSEAQFTLALIEPRRRVGRVLIEIEKQSNLGHDAPSGRRYRARGHRTDPPVAPESIRRPE